MPRFFAAADPVWPIEIALPLYAIVSFLIVATYAGGQWRAGTLLRNAPLPWTISSMEGAALSLIVFGLIFTQSILYPLAVVGGIAVFLLESRQTAWDQFGLSRIGPARLARWSIAICGAFLFLENPLDDLVTRALDFLGWPHPEQDTVQAFRQFHRASDIVVFMVLATVIYPMIEELFFRGFLFTFLKRYTSTWGAILFSGGVFAFAHANIGSAPQLWLLGIILALAYEHTGSLLLPIGIHGCWNFLTALYLLAEKGAT
jgi:membrane protease YdiL (CAAX protease family)